ncbi:MULTISPECIES: LysE/ArgO family amino acid transporter [Vibrio]|uniref:LysE/ArgO family amino acid transporter n=1 Tax=Vibrio TaxID=662 RepID=UPI0020231420|nr:MULTISPECIES: LysE family transporter [Vibrio]
MSQRIVQQITILSRHHVRFQVQCRSVLRNRPIQAFWYGYQSAKSAWKGSSHLELENSDIAQSWLKVVLMAMAITFLNPHVYLDTVVILGGVTAQMEPDEKLLFVIGALIASGGWFYGLVYLANKLIPLFSKPRTWRILDSAISCIMCGIALKLAAPLFSQYI